MTCGTHSASVVFHFVIVRGISINTMDQNKYIVRFRTVNKWVSCAFDIVL